LITPEETWAQSDSAECFRLSHAPDGGAAACPAGALSLSDFTSRLELPEAVTSFERMGSEWFVLRGERGLYAVRWFAGRQPEMWQLPEAEPVQPEASQ
jgi:hypothetical protein